MVTPKHRTDRPRTLQRWQHAPTIGIAGYDEELQVPHSTAHRIMVSELCMVLSLVAEEAGMQFLSDESIWYFDPRNDKQKVFYGDLVLAHSDAPIDRIIADDVRLVIEVVTTTDKRKERKDTVFQRQLNEANRVPEFVVVFPDDDDLRTLRYYRWVDDTGYEEQIVAPGGIVDIQGVPGLQLQVPPQAEWQPGRKLNIIYNGQLRLRYDQEYKRAIAAQERAEMERKRAETERKRAKTERKRAETERKRANTAEARLSRMTERLRDLGVEVED